jgi:hypothetical protein
MDVGGTDVNSTIEWLLEEKEPSIRYRTLTELLDYPNDNDEVISVKEKVAIWICD